MRWAVARLALLAAALVACADAPTAARRAPATAELPVLVSVSGTPTVGVVIRVTAPDITAPLVYNLPATGGTASGSVTLPVGRARTVTLEAIAPSGAVTHRGVAGPLTVAEGANAAVQVAMIPLGEQLPNGSATVGWYLRVSPSAITLRTGDRVHLKAFWVHPDSGRAFEVPREGGLSTVQWATTDPQRAVVDTSGAVVALAAGAVEIMAVARGGAARSRVEVTSVAATRWLHLATGLRNSCGITTDSLTYCWGSNRHGMLGLGSVDTTLMHSRPVLVPTPGGVPFVSLSLTSFNHACALNRDGAVFCWGSNEWGALGVVGLDDPACPGSVYCAAPIRVSLPAARAVTVGWRHSCALTTAGDAWCWGENTNLQLGAHSWDACGAQGDPCSRVPIRAAASRSFTAIAAGSWNTCGLDAGGATWCWGSNVHGEAGVDSLFSPGLDSTNGCAENFCRASPVQVAGAPAFRDISLGDLYACGITAADELYCWGGNWAGQLGRGVAATSGRFGGWQPTPERVTVAGLAALPVRAVNASLWDRACALTRGGEIHCWGTGYGVTPDLPISGRMRFESLAHGGAHGCAADRRGAAFCWGRGNLHGFLGNGGTRPTFTPAQVLEPAAR